MKRMIGVYFSTKIDWIGDDEIYVPGIIPGTILNVLRYPTTDLIPKKLVVIERRGRIPWPLSKLFNDPEINSCIVSVKTAECLGLDFNGDSLIIVESDHTVHEELVEN